MKIKHEPVPKEFTNSKNKKFRRIYVIEVSGITTHGFMVQVLNDAMVKVLHRMTAAFKQIEVKSVVSFGAWKLRGLKYCEDCKAAKWNDDDDCIFCGLERLDA